MTLKGKMDIKKYVCPVPQMVDKGVDMVNNLEETGVDMAAGIVKPIPIAGPFVQDQKDAFRNVKNSARRMVRRMRPCMK